MKISKKMKYTFFTSVAVGLLTHLFALTNVLQNYDNVSQTPKGLGTGITSGRWMLQLFISMSEKCGINYNIPWINGLLAIFLLSVTVCMIVDVMEMESTLLSAIFAAVFISFPVVTSTMFFMFVVEYDAFAIMLAIFAVWVSRKYGLAGRIVGAISCAVSMGIYQAYLPMTASLLVLLLLKEVLKGESQWKDVVLKALLDLGTLILGFACYLLCMKLVLAKYGVQLSNYQGIDNMGNLSLSSIPGLLKRTIGDVLKMPFVDYYGVTSTGIVRICIAVLALFSVGMMIMLLIVKKQKAMMIIECVILCVCFVLAVNSITIMCPDSKIYTLMVFGSVFIFLLPIMLTDLVIQICQHTLSAKADRGVSVLRNAVAVLLFLVISQYVWLANGNYMAMYYNTEQTKAYTSSMLTQIRMTEGFNTSLKWAFIGKLSDDTFTNRWRDAEIFHIGGNGVTEEKPLFNYYSRKSWFRDYMGYEIPFADESTVKSLAKKSFVKKMPCYPNYGSIKIYQDMVIIKLS